MIGQFPVQIKWTFIFLSVLAAYGTLFYRLRAERASKQILDILTNSLMLFILVWKLSYLFFSPLQTFKAPLNLLYFNGGNKGVALGMVIVLLYLIRVSKKAALPREKLFFAITWSIVSYYFFLRCLHFILDKSLYDILIAVVSGAILIYLSKIRSESIKVSISSLLVLSLAFTMISNLSFSKVQLDKNDPDVHKTSAIEVGKRAPTFKLQDLRDREVKLSSSKGKTVFVNVWATWCPPCRAEMPEMDRFYKEYKGDAEILAINLTESDSKQAVLEFRKEYGLDFPILLDPDGEITEIYKAVTVPTTYIINEKGIITEKHVGPMSYEMMSGYLND